MSRGRRGVKGGKPFPVFGVGVPPPVVIFGSVAASSVVADSIHEYVLPMIPQDQKTENIEALALSAVSGGLASSTALRMAGVPSTNMVKSFGLGAGSTIAGDYLYHRVLYPEDNIAF